MVDEADHRTGWNTDFESGMYRGVLCGIVLRDCPKQVLSMAKAKSVNFFVGHKDIFALTSRFAL